MQNVSLVKKIDYSLNSELKKLQFFGAGPKAALPEMLVGDTGQCHQCRQSTDMLINWVMSFVTQTVERETCGLGH